MTPDILHTLVFLYHILDDQRVCADSRTREGLEVRHVLFARQRCDCPVLVLDIQGMDHWWERLLAGRSTPLAPVTAM